VALIQPNDQALRKEPHLLPRTAAVWSLQLPCSLTVWQTPQYLGACAIRSSSECCRMVTSDFTSCLITRRRAENLSRQSAESVYLAKRSSIYEQVIQQQQLLLREKYIATKQADLAVYVCTCALPSLGSLRRQKSAGGTQNTRVCEPTSMPSAYLRRKASTRAECSR
jgi:hypothetical protein